MESIEKCRERVLSLWHPLKQAYQFGGNDLQVLLIKLMFVLIRNNVASVGFGGCV